MLRIFMTPYQNFCFVKNKINTKNILNNNSPLILQEKTNINSSFLKALLYYYKTHQRFPIKLKIVKEQNLLQSPAFLYYFKNISYFKNNYKNYFFRYFSLNSEVLFLKRKRLKDSVKDFKYLNSYNLINFLVLVKNFLAVVQKAQLFVEVRRTICTIFYKLRKFALKNKSSLLFIQKYRIFFPRFLLSGFPKATQLALSLAKQGKEANRQSKKKLVFFTTCEASGRSKNSTKNIYNKVITRSRNKNQQQTTLNFFKKSDCNIVKIFTKKVLYLNRYYKSLYLYDFRFYLLTLLSKTKKTNKWLNAIHYYLIKKLIKKNIKIPCSILLNYLNMLIRFVNFFNMIVCPALIKKDKQCVCITESFAFGNYKFTKKNIFFFFSIVGKTKFICLLKNNQLSQLIFFFTLKDLVGFSRKKTDKSKCFSFWPDKKKAKHFFYPCPFFLLSKKKGHVLHVNNKLKWVLNNKSKSFYDSLFLKKKSFLYNLTSYKKKKTKNCQKYDLIDIKIILFFYFSTVSNNSKPHSYNESYMHFLIHWTDEMCSQYYWLLSSLLTKKQSRKISQKQNYCAFFSSQKKYHLKTILEKKDYYLLLAKKQLSQTVLLWIIQQKTKNKYKKQKVFNLRKKFFFGVFVGFFLSQSERKSNPVLKGTLPSFLLCKKHAFFIKKLPLQSKAKPNTLFFWQSSILNLQQKNVIHTPVKLILWQWNKKNQNKNSLYSIFKKYWLKIASFYFFIIFAKQKAWKTQLQFSTKAVKKKIQLKKKKIIIYLPFQASPGSKAKSKYFCKAKIKKQKISMFFFRNLFQLKNKLQFHYKFFSIVPNDWNNSKFFTKKKIYSTTYFKRGRSIFGALNDSFLGLSPKKEYFCIPKASLLGSNLCKKTFASWTKLKHLQQSSNQEKDKKSAAFFIPQNFLDLNNIGTEMHFSYSSQYKCLVIKKLKALLEQATIKKVYFETYYLKMII